MIGFFFLLLFLLNQGIYDPSCFVERAARSGGPFWRDRKRNKNPVNRGEIKKNVLKQWWTKRGWKKNHPHSAQKKKYSVKLGRVNRNASNLLRSDAGHRYGASDMKKSNTNRKLVTGQSNVKTYIHQEKENSKEILYQRTLFCASDRSASTLNGNQLP